MKEQQHIEWKESWRDDGLRSICGFANGERQFSKECRQDQRCDDSFKERRTKRSPQRGGAATVASRGDTAGNLQAGV